MGEITHFVAMPFDLTSDGLVAGEPYKCASPGLLAGLRPRRRGGFCANRLSRDQNDGAPDIRQRARRPADLNARKLEADSRAARPHRQLASLRFDQFV
jgi:hypothetical protein